MPNAAWQGQRLGWAAAVLLAAASAAPAVMAQAQPAAPAPSAVTSYDAGFFARSAPDNAYDMIQLTPGFTFEEGDAVRGFGGAAGNVLIDGRRPSTKVDTLADILQRIPAASVVRIEVIRGGAPGIDMQGRSVLANVVRRSAAVSELTANASLYRFGDGHGGARLRIDGARRDGEYGLEGSLVLFRQQNENSGAGRRTLTAAGGEVISDADAKIIEPTDAVKAAGAWQRPLWDGLFRIKGHFTYGTDHLYENDSIFAGSIGVHDDVRTSTFRTRQGELSADYTRNIGPRAELQLIALQSLEKAEDVGNALQQGVIEHTRDSANQGESIGRGTLKYRISDGLSAEGGGEYAFNFLDGHETLNIGGVDIALPSARVHVQESRGEGFLTLSGKVSPRFSYEAGARVEASTLSETGDESHTTSFFFVKPRATATWTPFGEDQLRLRIERTVSQLDFTQFVTNTSFDTHIVTAGNPGLTPERDWIFEAAYEHHFGKAGVATLTVSHAELQDVIDELPVAGFSAPGNIGSGRRETVAFDLTTPLAAVGLPGGVLKANGTWKFSEVTDPTTHTRRQITLDEPFAGSLALTNDLPKLKSNWRIDVISGHRQPTFLIDEVDFVRYQTQVDFLWEYKPRADISLQAQVQNLTSRARLRERRIFDGLRGAGPPDFVEQRALTNRPRLFFNLRKSF